MIFFEFQSKCTLPSSHASLPFLQLSLRYRSLLRSLSLSDSSDDASREIRELSLAYHSIWHLVEIMVFEKEETCVTELLLDWVNQNDPLEFQWEEELTRHVRKGNSFESHDRYWEIII